MGQSVACVSVSGLQSFHALRLSQRQPGVSVSENLQRRTGKDRRSRTLLSLLLGSFKRRRHGPRRGADGSIAVTDWHGSPLLAAGVLILVLCVVDALLTLALLGHGAYEANPLMDTVVHGD